jgi:polar amino acid transport system substrate-binding protein
VWTRIAVQVLVVGTWGSGALAVDTPPKSLLPHMRHADPSAQALQKLPDASLTLLTDEDFAPFSFRAANGNLTGIAIDLAAAACSQLQVKCQIVPKPYAELVPALEKKEGTVILAGPGASPALLQGFDMTRPYFASSAEFLVRLGSSLQRPDPKSLAGKRLGFVKGTAHEAFVEKYYARAALTAYDDEALMLNALRSGGLDTAFIDSLHAAFWLRGADARGCCVVLGQPITDRAGLSKGLAMIIDKSRPDVTAAFDQALDVLDENSETAKIFARYLPAVK